MRKDSYEISVWEDFFSTDIPECLSPNRVMGFFDERKIGIIGSESMTSQNRATDPILIEKDDGTNELTFTLYYEYIDNETGEKVRNPFVKLLSNETKVKVRWHDKWYDLIVKSQTKDKKKKSIVYKCTDQFIYELSKSGYNVELDDELKNSSGTIEELGARVLRDTDWQVRVDETHGQFFQYQRERLYRVKLERGVKAYNEENVAIEFFKCAEFNDVDQTNGTKYLAYKDEWIYVPYSVMRNSPGFFQCFYRPQIKEGYQSSITTDFGKDDLLTPEWECYYALWQIQRGSNKTDPNTGADHKNETGYMVPYKGSTGSLWNPLVNRIFFKNTEHSTPPELLLKYGERAVRSTQQVWVDALEGFCDKVTEKKTDKKLLLYTKKDLSGNPNEMMEETSNFYKTNNWHGTRLKLTDKAPDNNSKKNLITRLQSKSSFFYDLSSYIDDNYLLLQPGKKYILELTYKHLSSDINGEDWRQDISTPELTPEVGLFNFPTTKIEETGGYRINLDQSRLGGSVELLYLDESGLKPNSQYLPFDINNTRYNAQNSPNYAGFYNTDNKILKKEVDGETIYTFVKNQMPTVGFADWRLISSEFTRPTSEYKDVLEITLNKMTLDTEKSKEYGVGLFFIFGTLSDAYSTFSVSEDEGSDEGITIKEISFFPKIPRETTTTGERDYLRPIEDKLDSDVTTESLQDQMKEQTYYTYILEDNKEVPKEQLKFYYSSTTPLEVKENYTFKQIRNISEKQSNRYNILKNIAESFEGYCRFEYEHDKTGKIVKELVKEYEIPGLSEIWYTKKDKKSIVFTKQLGKETNLAFQYGVDLQGMNRVEDTSQIITKLYCSPISVEGVSGGTCEISKSGHSVNGDNFIYNFDHYFNNGKLPTAARMNLDETNSRILSFNNEYDKWATSYRENSQVLENLKTQIKMAKLEIKELDEQRLETQQDMMNGTYIANPDYNGTSGNVPLCIGPLDEKSKILEPMTPVGWSSTGTTWTGEWSGEYSSIVAYRTGEGEPRDQKNNLNQLQTIATDILNKTQQISEKLKDLEGIQEKVDLCKAKMEECLLCKESTRIDFEKRWSQFVHEGVWSPTTYVDNDQYYLDAEYAARLNGKAKITYNIQVLRLSALEEFGWKDFSVGDVMYARDKEFFGDEMQEKVTITEKASHFDTPSKDSIKVQNHRSRFDTLMQKLFQAK